MGSSMTRLRPLLCGLLLCHCSGSDSGAAEDAAADSALPRDATLDQPAAPAVPRPIRDLVIIPNPTSVLSCHLVWSTEQPASSSVEFGRRPDAPEYRIRSRILTRQHRLLVIGLQADTPYYLRAVSPGQSGVVYRSEARLHRTRSLPAHIPRGTVTVHNRARAHDGWTLMAVAAGSRGSSGAPKNFDKDFPPSLVMYDMSGAPVWYRTHGLGIPGDASINGDLVLTHGPFSLVDEKHYSALEYDLAGRLVWTGPMQGETVPDRFHHAFVKLAGGTYVGLTRTVKDYVLGDNVVQLDRDHNRIWTWSIFDHLKPDRTGSAQGGNHDWSHFNSMVMDSRQQALFVMSRNLDMVLKIDVKSGKIIWRLGQQGDFAIDTTEHPWFARAHAVELQPGGNVLLYDNGTRSRGFSRAIEYAVDEQAKKARIVWQYQGTGQDRWATYYWGDADRLPNGNTLISAGTWDSGQWSKVFEVTPEGQKVWEMRLPVRASSGSLVGMYNSQRLRPPLLEAVGARQ